jgi:copper chaperone
MRELSLQVNGMSCGHCLKAVNGALSTLPGLELGSVRIGGAELRYDPAAVTPEQVVAAVREAGYEAVVVRQ